MPRHRFTDREFKAIRHLLPKQQPGKPGRRWSNHRTIVDGILWVTKTGGPDEIYLSNWRDGKPSTRDFGDGPRRDSGTVFIKHY
ncbi:hypothetical protein Poly24_31110 [Rosistilla carotiformis]|uniref:Insertion element IS402-like domain-containing protein n=1 Tax=Rosistilla carotiformis TaxID=2528017 RepID=A0A518JV20_9BACT|nr:hypothetical protein Poly24_31110 [Rosistilla carotiformis]